MKVATLLRNWICFMRKAKAQTATPCGAGYESIDA